MTLDFEGAVIRVVGTPESPEWVVDDLCKVLQIKNASQAAQRVPPLEKGICIIDTLGGPQKLTTVKEPGLYRLIAKGRTAQAERFRTWLFNDVLPSIRKHGCYPPPELTIQDTSLVRIDEDAFARALGKELGPRFASIESRFNQVDEKIGQVDEKIGELQSEVNSIAIRRSLPDKVQRLHVQVCYRMCNGICPCCGIIRITNEHGQRLPVLQFDHWYLRSQSSADKTWPVCRECNQRLRDGDFHDECEVLFKAYQARRRQLEVIMSPDRQQRRLGFSK